MKMILRGSSSIAPFSPERLQADKAGTTRIP
jgi:hypothetical protein